MDNLKNHFKSLIGQLQLNFTPILAGLAGVAVLPPIIGIIRPPTGGPNIKGPNEDSIGCADATGLINTMRMSIQARATAAGLALARKLNPAEKPSAIRPPDLTGESAAEESAPEDLSGSNTLSISEDISGSNTLSISEDLSANTLSTPEDIQKEEISLQEGGDLSGLSVDDLSGLSVDDLSGLSVDDLSGVSAVGTGESGESDEASESDESGESGESDEAGESGESGDVSLGYFSKTDEVMLPMPEGSQKPSQRELNIGKPMIFQRVYTYQQGFNRCWNQMFNSIWQPSFVRGYNSLKRTSLDASAPSLPGSEDLSGTTTLETYSEDEISSPTETQVDEEVEPTGTQVDEDGNTIYPDTGSVVPEEVPEEDTDPEALQRDELDYSSRLDAVEVPPL